MFFFIINSMSCKFINLSEFLLAEQRSPSLQQSRKNRFSVGVSLLRITRAIARVSCAQNLRDFHSDLHCASSCAYSGLPASFLIFPSIILFCVLSLNWSSPLTLISFFLLSYLPTNCARICILHSPQQHSRFFFNSSVDILKIIMIKSHQCRRYFE
jgi:hypothetical protein